MTLSPASCPAQARVSRPPAAKPRSADARLREIYETEWTWRRAEFVFEADPHAPIPDHLQAVDPAAQQRRLEYWRKVLAELEAIPRAELSAAERLNYDIYRPQIEDLVANQKFRDFEMPANSDTNFWTLSPYIGQLHFRNAEDYRRWIAQMRDLPRYFREQMLEMRAGLARGFTPPKVTMEGRDASIAAVTDVAPEATVFYQPFLAMNKNVPEARQAELAAEARRVIGGEVQPAYAELLKFMRTEYLPGLRTTLAAEDLPDGKAYYRAKIREYTTLDLGADEIHTLGLAEVARLHGEMLAAMTDSGFKGDFAAFQEYLRTDPKFYAKSPEELLMRAAWIAKQFDGVASSYFGYLPRARFAIRPVPPDLAPYFTAGRGGLGLYSLNTYDLPSRPLYNLPALTLHESAPGHAFQTAIALEHDSQPEFRKASYFSSYGEGWALYCERLGLEMGLYPTPYERFGMLGYQIWRAARLVVDTGLHSKGWSREQAREYMRQYTGLSAHEIETEVDRYITWPGQALSYYLGERTFLEARAKAEKALGERFNIRAFHDAVLELGAVPMPVLSAAVDRFIEAGGKGPYPKME
jgi:uncharacterized protein (DUF885 family)